MDVITTTCAEKIAEKKKIKHGKLNERRKLKKRMDQNVVISSKENCHEIDEAGPFVGPGVDLEKSSQVDRAHAEEITEKNEKQSEKLNGMRKKKLMNLTNQNIETSTNETRHLIEEGGSFEGSSVESLLRGSSEEDRAANYNIENKRTAFKDEPLLELSKGERVLSDTGKENSQNVTKKRKRKSKRKGGNIDEFEPMVLEHKDLHISNNEKSCIRAEVGVDVVSLGEDSPKVDKILTDIVKEKSQQRVTEKRCNSKTLGGNKVGQVILNQANKCLEISVDQTCISETESGIEDANLTFEPVLQESAEGKEVSIGIVEEKQNPVGKKKRKKKSKARNKDGKAILEEDKCLTISADSKSCIAAAESGINGVGSVVESVLLESFKVEDVSTDIVTEDKIPGGKRKRKKKLKARNKDENIILDEEVTCVKLPVDGKSSIATAELGINGLDSTVESLLSESPVVDEVSMEIVQKQNTPIEKQRKKRKSKDRGKDEKVIVGEEDKCLKISVENNSGIAAAESGINGVDSIVEPLLQESPKVEEVSTDIVKEDKIPGGKRKRKKKSKDRGDDGKAILGEDGKRVMISSDGKRCVAAAGSIIKDVDLNVESLIQDSAVVDETSTEIVEEKKSPEGKRRRGRKSKSKNKVEIPIIEQQDELLVTSIDRKCCTNTEVSTLQDVDSLTQDSAGVDKASIEIVEEKMSPEGKRRRRRKSKSKNKVEIPIIEQQYELLVTPIDEKCCTNTEMSTLQGVDSRSKCPSDVVSSPVSNGVVDLSNGLYRFPQRAVTTCSRRILLILDINGLLADIVMPPPKERKSDINMLGRAIFKRPYCDDFLDFCFDTFDVGIWSSRTKRVIDKVVDYLLGKRKQKLLFCWDVSHTTVSKFRTLENSYKPLVCKSLRNIWETTDPSLPWEKGDYTESNTLLIDDSPYKALLNPMHTAIFPYSFTYKDLHDDSLGPEGEIREYLENLVKTDDVRKYVEQNPFGQSAITEKSSSWDFYSKVINSLSQF